MTPPPPRPDDLGPDGGGGARGGHGGDASGERGQERGRERGRRWGGGGRRGRPTAVPARPGRDARRGRGPRWRLFVAAIPPEPVRRRLVAAAETVAANDPDLRVLDPEVVHLTVLFIGDTHPAEVADVETSIERAASGLAPPRIEPASIEPLPGPEHPRLIAAVAPCPPGLAELHRRLVTRLARPRERRRDFVPHCTIGRWPGGRGPAIAPAMPEVPADCAFAVDAVTLVRSRLRPEGARHEPLGRVPLTGP